jgi:O-antigen/teichoic acid export membrane protein
MLSLLFYSSVPFAVGLCFLEFLTILILIYSGVMNGLFDPQNAMDTHLLDENLMALIIYSFYWLIATSVSGLAGRLVTPFGYFPRFAWWGVLIATFAALTSAISVSLGANLLTTVIVLVLVDFIVNIPVFIDLWNICKKHDLIPVRPDWVLGLKIMIHSIALATSSVFDLLRQQGIRVFLSSLVGVVEMTAFSTMRTLSNVTLQGIGTITNPMMPEIMQYLRNRDQQRLVSSMGFVWLLSVIMLAPCMVLFQWIMPKIFVFWTRGKIGYDPGLFALFSMALLIFAIARPAAAILQGNNLLRKQVVISFIIGVIGVGGVVLLASTFGIKGAGFSLLLAEVVSTILNVFSAQKWLRSNGLLWPWELFNVTLASIILSSIAITMIVILPSYSVLILMISTILNSLILIPFVRYLPDVAIVMMKKTLFRYAGK